MKMLETITQTIRLLLRQQATDAEPSRGTLSLSPTATVVIDHLAARRSLGRMAQASQIIEEYAWALLNDESGPGGLELTPERLCQLLARYGHTPVDVRTFFGVQFDPHALLSPTAALDALLTPVDGDTPTQPLASWLSDTFGVSEGWLTGQSDLPANPWPSPQTSPNINGVLHKLQHWTADRTAVPTLNAGTARHGALRLISIKRDDVSRADLLGGTEHSRLLLAVEVKSNRPGERHLAPVTHAVPLGTYAPSLTHERTELMAVMMQMRPRDIESLSCTAAEYSDLLTGRLHVDDLLTGRAPLLPGQRAIRNRVFTHHWLPDDLIATAGLRTGTASNEDKAAARAHLDHYAEGMRQLEAGAGVPAGPTAEKQ